MDKLSAADIVATVDLSNVNVTTGVVSVPVTFSLPTNVNAGVYGNAAGGRCGTVGKIAFGVCGSAKRAHWRLRGGAAAFWGAAHLRAGRAASLLPAARGFPGTSAIS